MEEYRTVFYDRIHELGFERLNASDSVAYAAKCDFLRTFVDTIL